MGVKLLSGLFLMGLGLGPAIHSMLPSPLNEFPQAWLIFVLAGIILIIIDHK